MHVRRSCRRHLRLQLGDHRFEQQQQRPVHVGGGGDDVIILDFGGGGTGAASGGTGTDILRMEYDGDISRMAISGFETLDVGGGVTATLAQLAAFDLITGDIFDNGGAAFFVTGPGGAFNFGQVVSPGVGVHVRAAQVASAVAFTGTARRDDLSGTAFSDTLRGGDGNDSLQGLAVQSRHFLDRVEGEAFGR